MRKKIGIVAQYLNSRHDVREFINTLARYHEVVVFLRPHDKQLSSLLADKIEVRTIDAKIDKSIWNNVLIILYKLFGKLPVSEHNYFITEFFKLNNVRLSKSYRMKETFLLNLSKFTPKFISYDGYLKALHYKRSTKVDDVDEFLCFTQIYDDLFFAHVLETGKRTKVYVYSWDHPCKMKTFSNRVSEYLVWNKGLKEDLIALQFIEAQKIRIFGATQLTYIHDFLEDSKPYNRYYPFEYIYFACATGYPKLVKQEVAVIEKTAAYLATAFPELKLVVRTYPFFGAEEHYASFKNYTNIVVDDYKSRFDPEKEPLEVIKDKLMKISTAKGVIHLGTTFGLEAAYFNSPVILADMVSEYQELHEFVHQYQNDKYLHLKYSNIPQTFDSYEKALQAIIEQDQKMLLYNKEVASTTDLYSMDSLAQRL